MIRGGGICLCAIWCLTSEMYSCSDILMVNSIWLMDLCALVFWFKSANKEEKRSMSKLIDL